VRRSLAVLALLMSASTCTSVARQVTATLTAGPQGSTPSSTPPPAASRSIVVTAPLPHAEVSSPVRVSGTAEIPSGVLRIQVVDQDGEVIAATDADLACGLGCRGPFDSRVAFVTKRRQAASIEVFQLDEDGSVGDAVRVAVTLFPRW
jgi:hypothetical protein